METESLGPCSVCGQTSTRKCGGCKKVFYCDKEHQSEHWPRHKQDCQAWEIYENEELGRYLVAKRDLKAGDEIIVESPLVWGPALHSDERICVGCGRKCDDFSYGQSARCSKCHWPACKIHCIGLEDKNRHGMECQLLEKARIVPRCDILLVIRMMIMWQTNSKRWAALEKLQSHEEARREDPTTHEEVMEIINHLQRFTALNQVTEEVIEKICGLIDINALETMPPEGCMAIYEITSLLEHSCLSNTGLTFAMNEKGKPRVTVRTLCPVKKGEHLSTMYTHALWATRARRAHLLATKHFSCKCARCADPTELGTHIGTLRCPQDNGLILPKDPLNIDTEWQCDTCAGGLSADEAADLVGQLEAEVDRVMVVDKDALVELLSRLTTLLHPGHQQCITVSHSLIQLLAPSDPQKARLCKLIIETTSRLDPYGARVPLYTAVALRELSNCPGQDRKALLTQASGLLRNEPSGSTGEKLKRLIDAYLIGL